MRNRTRNAALPPAKGYRAAHVTYYPQKVVDGLLAQCRAAFPNLTFKYYLSVQYIICTNSNDGMMGQVHVGDAGFMRRMETEIDTTVIKYLHQIVVLQKLIEETK